MTHRKQDPNQRLVPGFGLWLKDCRRDAAKLKAERNPKPLPLFDRLEAHESVQARPQAPAQSAPFHSPHSQGVEAPQGKGGRPT